MAYEPLPRWIIERQVKKALQAAVPECPTHQQEELTVRALPLLVTAFAELLEADVSCLLWWANHDPEALKEILKK